MSYVVAVTYGTKENQCYANAWTKEAAQKLKEAAEERGYRDARIVPADDFYAQQKKRAA